MRHLHGNAENTKAHHSIKSSRFNQARCKPGAKEGLAVEVAHSILGIAAVLKLLQNESSSASRNRINQAVNQEEQPGHKFMQKHGPWAAPIPVRGKPKRIQKDTHANPTKRDPSTRNPIQDATTDPAQSIQDGRLLRHTYHKAKAGLDGHFADAVRVVRDGVR